MPFVPPTPGSILADRIRKMELETRPRRTWAFRVVELGGEEHKVTTPNSQPCHSSCLWASDCIPCLSDNLGICARTNVCYKITCLKCPSGPTPPAPPGNPQQPTLTKPHLYLGETSCNLRTRSSDHARQFLTQRPQECLVEAFLNFPQQ